MNRDPMGFGQPPFVGAREIRAYERGVKHGWLGAAAFYVVGTVVLILAFHFLGVRP